MKLTTRSQAVCAEQAANSGTAERPREQAAEGVPFLWQAKRALGVYIWWGRSRLETADEPHEGLAVLIETGYR